MLRKDVYHPKYGLGVVIRSRNRGFEILVAFEKGLTRWVRFDEVDEAPLFEGEPRRRTSVAASVDAHFEARKMIEAFRLGIVPYDCVTKFTFGRDLEIKRLDDWLNTPDRATLILEGGYGTGKTHLLQYLYNRALEERFAVAHVEIDSNETPFHNPKRIYSSLVRTFRYLPERDQRYKRFRDFVREVLARGAFYDHRYFKYLKDRDEDEELFWEWIEGTEAILRPEKWAVMGSGYPVNKYSYVPGLYGYATAANIYCYILSSLGWAAQKVLGLKGLLLLFDEAETLNITSTRYQREKGKNFFTALILTAEEDPYLIGQPEKSELCYCTRALDVPFIYKVPTGLKLLFAFTDAAFTDAEGLSLPKLELKELDDLALKEVFEHLYSLYRRAYGLDIQNITKPKVDTIFQKVLRKAGRTRTFLKGAVEAFDLTRLNPGKPIDEVLK